MMASGNEGRSGSCQDASILYAAGQHHRTNQKRRIESCRLDTRYQPARGSTAARSFFKRLRGYSGNLTRRTLHATFAEHQDNDEATRRRSLKSIDLHLPPVRIMIRAARTPCSELIEAINGDAGAITEPRENMSSDSSLKLMIFPSLPHQSIPVLRAAKRGRPPNPLAESHRMASWLEQINNQCLRLPVVGSSV